MPQQSLPLISISQVVISLKAMEEDDSAHHTGSSQLGIMTVVSLLFTKNFWVTSTVAVASVRMP